MISEQELERLESYLDGECAPEDEQALRRRLDAEPALAWELEQLRADRSARGTFFASLEADEETSARVFHNVRREIRRRQTRIVHWKRFCYGTAAAACVLAAFFAGAGWMGSSSRTGDVAASPEFKVEIRDERGRVMAVQKFDSLERAQEFSRDLEQWQQRQERLLNGDVTIHSDRF